MHREESEQYLVVNDQSRGDVKHTVSLHSELGNLYALAVGEKI